MSLHISQGIGVLYFGAFRRRGCRKFETLVKPSKSRARVVSQTASLFERIDYKSAVVAMVADYYEPIAVMKLERP